MSTKKGEAASSPPHRHWEGVSAAIKMTHSEKVKLARNKWKATKLGRLYHAYNVLMARGWYLSDKRELARVRRLEVKIQEVENETSRV